MKKISIEEQKKIELEELLSVDEFCRKNNIKYYLCGGTLLGAVRHNGFIPWDDDIDIAMARPDYEKFIASYKHDYFSVFAWRDNNRVLCTYTKIIDRRTLLYENSDFGEDLGVNIDVFPVDGLPKGKENAEKHVRKMKRLWGLVVCATVKDISKRTLIRKIEISFVRFLFSIFKNKHFIVGYVIRKAKKIPFAESNYVAVVLWGYGLKEIIHRKVAEELIEHDFEGHSLYIPKNYDEYLKKLYGDYMQLPPESDRIYKHGTIAYWK